MTLQLNGNFNGNSYAWPVFVVHYNNRHDAVDIGVLLVEAGTLFLLPVSRRASKALVENQLHVRYSGSCADARASIAESFASTITRLVHDEHGPCPAEHRCSVEHIRVVCGGGRSRRRRCVYCVRFVLINLRHCGQPWRWLVAAYRPS